MVEVGQVMLGGSSSVLVARCTATAKQFPLSITLGVHWGREVAMVAQLSHVHCGRREKRGGDKMDGWRSERSRGAVRSSRSNSFSLSFQLNRQNEKGFRFWSFQSGEARKCTQSSHWLQRRWGWLLNPSLVTSSSSSSWYFLRSVLRCLATKTCRKVQNLNYQSFYSKFETVGHEQTASWMTEYNALITKHSRFL